MKVLGVSLFVVCCVQFKIGLAAKSGCSLPVSPPNEDLMPVLINGSYSLVMPHNGYVDLRKGQDIILLCPVRGKSKTNTNATDATCVGGTTLKVSNRNKDFENIVCDTNVRGSAITTQEECGGGEGSAIGLGFPIDDDFLTLIEVCYDNKNGNALYASHILHGKEINYASKTNTRPAFSVEGLAPKVSANAAYKQAFQKATFNSLLGSSTLASKYIYQNSYLARGHLAPDADFLFAPWQFATYFYVNTVPQWQAINNGNWKQLEMMVRDAADNYAEDLKVYTGSHKILELDTVLKKKTKIYLVSGKLLPVPKFVWKILHSERTHKAVAFISVNNPFIGKLKTSDKLCTDICNRYGWARESFKNSTRGIIYCCDVRDFLRVIKTGPSIGKVNGVLTGPQSNN